MDIHMLLLMEKLSHIKGQDYQKGCTEGMQDTYLLGPRDNVSYDMGYEDQQTQEYQCRGTNIPIQD